MTTLTTREADVMRLARNGWTEEALCKCSAVTHPAPPADLVELVEALRELLHAYCSDTGFAAAVRQDTGLAYPWAPGEIAEARARAALAKHGVA